MSRKSQGSQSVLQGLPRADVRQIVIQVVAGVIVVVLTGIISWKGLHDIFGNGIKAVDIHVELFGVAAPGDVIQLQPVRLARPLSKHHDVWFRNVDFSLLKGQRIEIFRIDKTTQTSVADIEIGDKPVIDVHVESETHE